MWLGVAGNVHLSFFYFDKNKIYMLYTSCVSFKVLLYSLIKSLNSPYAMSVPSGRLRPPLLQESMAACTRIGRFTFITYSGHKSRLCRTFSNASWMHNIFGWCVVISLLSSCLLNKSSILIIVLDQEYLTYAIRPSSLNSIREFVDPPGNIAISNTFSNWLSGSLYTLHRIG